MTRTIGGVMDYAALARVHKPRTSEAMRAAIHEMAARGMREHEIAVATELAVSEVRRILGPPGARVTP